MLVKPMGELPMANFENCGRTQTLRTCTFFACECFATLPSASWAMR